MFLDLRYCLSMVRGLKQAFAKWVLVAVQLASERRQFGHIGLELLLNTKDRIIEMTDKNEMSESPEKVATPKTRKKLKSVLILPLQQKLSRPLKLIRFYNRKKRVWSLKRQLILANICTCSPNFYKEEKLMIDIHHHGLGPPPYLENGKSSPFDL